MTSELKVFQAFLLMKVNDLRTKFEFQKLLDYKADKIIRSTTFEELINCVPFSTEELITFVLNWKAVK